MRQRRHCALAGSLSVLLLLLGCAEPGTSPYDAPAAPLTPTGPGYLWGHVLDASGVCIPGAMVEIVDGPGAGRRVTQSAACNAWDYVAGFEFSGLGIGKTVRLRATAAGHRPDEIVVVTQDGGAPIQFELMPE